MEAPTAFILYNPQEAEQKMRIMEQSGKERGDGLQWLKEAYGAQITAQRRSDLIAAAWGRTRNNKVALFRASAGLAVSVRTNPEDLPRAGPVPTAAPAPDTVPEQLAPPAPGAPLPDLDLRTWNLDPPRSGLKWPPRGAAPTQKRRRLTSRSPSPRRVTFPGLQHGPRKGVGRLLNPDPECCKCDFANPTEAKLAEDGIVMGRGGGPRAD